MSSSKSVNFPNFKTLKIQDKEELVPYISKFQPYSDFNFTSLICYVTNDDAYYSWLNNNLVIKYRDYITKESFYSFLGTSNFIDTTNQLITLSEKQNLPGILRLIPEVSVQDALHQEHNFIIKEDQDSHDYMIPLDKSAELSNINDHKKKSYENFISQYPNYKIKELDLTKISTQDEIMKLFNLWQKQKNKSNEDVSSEKLALEKLILYNSHFSLLALGIYIENELIGYVIDELLENTFTMGHFIKANLSYKGIYEVLNKVSAERHCEKKYVYLNIEQDLGIKGLRISKLQRSPSFYLKKYTISRK